MEAERWRQVEQLCQAALDCAPGQRTAFLDQACADDEELRREIESLLGYQTRAEYFIEAPALEIAAEALTRELSPQLIGRKIAHHQILSLLGRGGMGEVYLAQDTKLGRMVALKLLPIQFTEDAERVQRFEQEARAASALNHPNIITIYEIGQTSAAAGGVRYIVTEFVEGETLRQQMACSAMELGRALEVVTQVAAALAEAHKAGIVHRDIKPENVMMRRDGLVKVLDFGLAKLTGRQAYDSNLPTAPLLSTAPGVVMGTAKYMSPEQARGQEVDARTDIFSLGVMVYEIVAGHAPFTGATASDVMAAILMSEPPRLRHQRPEVPCGLEHIVGKCLEKEREKRYQSARALLLDLNQLKRELDVIAPIAAPESQLRPRLPMSRRWLAIGALVMVMAATLGYVLLQGTRATIAPEIKSLAVLPLENLSGDPAQEYFADGITEALISNLAQIGALSRVISRTSVMRYKGGRSKSLPEIAQELNVDALIEGTVRRSGGRVRVTVRLIPASADSPTWSRDYERDEGDVLKLESEVARAVADEIRIQVTPLERERLSAARRIDPAAYESYQLGSYHSQKFNEEDLKRAIEHFERAIQLDRDYAAAYAGLSEAWRARGVVGGKTFKEVEAPARAAALKAIELDPNLADAHAMLGNLEYIYDRDWLGAEEELKRAVALDPNSLFPHLAYAYLLMALGRFPEALAQQQTAAQLDPTTAQIRADIGRILYFAGEYAEAIAQLNRALELDPRSDFANSYLADVYNQMGRYEEALAAIEKAQAQRQDYWVYKVQRAVVYAHSGRRDKVLRMVKEFKIAKGIGSVPEIGLAQVYVVLGDKDEAFRLLTRVTEGRDQFSSFIKIDPLFQSLHSDPRWRELLRRMGLSS